MLQGSQEQPGSGKKGASSMCDWSQSQCPSCPGGGKTQGVLIFLGFWVSNPGSVPEPAYQAGKGKPRWQDKQSGNVWGVEEQLSGCAGGGGRDSPAPGGGKQLLGLITGNGQEGGHRQVGPTAHHPKLS